MKTLLHNKRNCQLSKDTTYTMGKKILNHTVDKWCVSRMHKTLNSKKVINYSGLKLNIFKENI